LRLWYGSCATFFICYPIIDMTVFYVDHTFTTKMYYTDDAVLQW